MYGLYASWHRSQKLKQKCVSAGSESYITSKKAEVQSLLCTKFRARQKYSLCQTKMWKYSLHRDVGHMSIKPHRVMSTCVAKRESASGLQVLEEHNTVQQSIYKYW